MHPPQPEIRIYRNLIKIALTLIIKLNDRFLTYEYEITSHRSNCDINA
jgi:hypothetical protein